MNPVERRILVIDNDAAARELTERLLVEEGFVVAAAADGPAALRALETGAFALIITELQLPAPLDGLAAARAARERQPWLKCLFTSDVPTTPVWDNRDLDDFIAKPFQRRELVGCVFELLQRAGPPVGGVPGSGGQPGGA